MKCPACRTSALERRDHSGLPTTQDCSSCGGRWLSFDAHLAWLEQGGGAAPTPPRHPGPPQAPPRDRAARARACPRCGKLLTRYRVSADEDFLLDRCAACGGIWFDPGEWQAVLTLVPLARIQHLFNDAHQHRLSAELRRREHEQRCRLLLGEEAFEKALAFKRWMKQHPRPDAVLAFLDDRDMEPGAGTPAGEKP